MYEIWLGMNVMFEVLRPWLALLGVALALWIALMVVAKRESAQWRAALKPAVVVAAIATLGAVPLVPYFTNSSVLEARYWLDWMALLGISGGVGGVVLAWTWPVMAITMRKP